MTPKPRLLFVVHSLQIGGAERLVVQMAEALSRQYEIGICCLDAKGTLWDTCAARGYTLFNLARAPGWQLRTLLAAAAAVRDFAPDVIHAHQYTPYVYAVVGKLLSRSAARLVFTEHGRHFPDIVSRKRRLANVLLTRFADRVTAVSEFSRNALSLKEGFDAERIQVIYNGLFQEPHSNAAQSLHAELGLSEDTSLIGYIGSLRSVKNPAYLIESFALLAETHRNACLVLIGEGPLRQELEEQVHNLGLEGRVFLLGSRNPATPYLSSFSVFVLPSRSEAASLALLEAMAGGVPSVATATGGTPELLSDGETGYLVPCDDAEALASRLRELLEQPERRASFGQKAQEVVRSRFQFSAMLDSYRELYEELQ